MRLMGFDSVQRSTARSHKIKVHWQSQVPRLCNNTDKILALARVQHSLELAHRTTLRKKYVNEAQQVLIIDF